MDGATHEYPGLGVITNFGAANATVDRADPGTSALFHRVVMSIRYPFVQKTKVDVMKRKLILALLSLSVVVALPGLAAAGRGGRYHDHGGRVFHVGSAFWGGGFRPDGAGLEYHPYYTSDYGYGYAGCSRWVGWPYPHRVSVCF